MSTMLDTRDLDKRLNELRSLKDDLETATAELDEHKATPCPVDDDELEEYDETTADNVRADYGEVEYQGTTYLYRA